MSNNTKNISIKDVEKVAALSRIHVTEEEKEKLTGDLSKILDYIKKLEKLDISSVEPTSHVLPLKNVFREDKVTHQLTQKQALSIAVEQKDGAFKVPKVIE